MYTSKILLPGYESYGLKNITKSLGIELKSHHRAMSDTEATADLFKVGAGLSASTASTSTEILDEIYKNRCIELYMSGLKLEDMRRFGRPLTERKRNFFPYPFRERDGNPNTPSDPSF